MRTPEEQTVVVGAGLAGSVAALELAKRDQEVILVEKWSFEENIRLGSMRSEMTHGSVIRELGAEDSITVPLNTVRFIGLDNGYNFETSIPLVESPSENTAVAIDHATVMQKVYGDIGRCDGIEVYDGREVERVVENKEGVLVIFKDGETKCVSAVVDAAGPSWTSLPFPDIRRQMHYEKSIVAIACGRRCRGEILMEGGDNMMLHPISTETGKTSWANCSGDGEIEVVYSDYCVRGDVCRVDQEGNYKKLVDRLVTQGLIRIHKEGPVISGFFGLEPSRTPPGTDNVYYFGERGCYNAPTVGDAIAPTVRLGPVLADHVVERRGARSFHGIAQSQFNSRFEFAVTLARMNAKFVGGSLDFFAAVGNMSEDERKDFLVTHKVLPSYLVRPILENPKLALTIRNVARYYLSLLMRDLGDKFPISSAKEDKLKS
jgi:flavin-dependent dehydrogenase